MTAPFPRIRKRAFTLVEVSLAMLIVAVGMIGVITVLPAGSQSGREAREDTGATMVAQSILSDVRGYLQRPGATPAGYSYQPANFFVGGVGQIQNGNGPLPVHRNDPTVYGDAYLGYVRLNIGDAGTHYNVTLDFYRGNYARYAGNAAIENARVRRFGIQVRKP